MRLTWVVELLMVSATGKDIIKTVSPNEVCVTVCIHISRLYVVSIHLSLRHPYRYQKFWTSYIWLPFLWSLSTVNFVCGFVVRSEYRSAETEV